jgi:ribosomal protein S9
MATTARFRGLHKCFQLFIATSLMACSDPEESKVVTRHGRNGQGGNGNGSGKPTPEAGVSSAGYAAIAFIATKQLSRTLDLALNESKSLLINKCQKLTKTTSGKVDTISVATPKNDCRAFNWHADEKIEVTYENDKRDASKKLVSIQKTQTGRIKIDRKRSGRTREIDLDDTTLKFSHIEGSKYNFEYIGDIESTFSLENSKSGANEKTSRARVIDENTIELQASGTVDISKGLWSIDNVKAKVVQLLRNGRSFTSVPTLTPDDLSKNVKLVCGLPVGTFAMSQEITSDEKTKSYNATITVDDSGTVSAAKSSKKYLTRGCEDGFTDLETSLNTAEVLIRSAPQEALNLEKRGMSGRNNKRNRSQIEEEQAP